MPSRWSNARTCSPRRPPAGRSLPARDRLGTRPSPPPRSSSFAPWPWFSRPGAISAAMEHEALRRADARFPRPWLQPQRPTAPRWVRVGSAEGDDRRVVLGLLADVRHELGVDDRAALVED